MSKSVLKVMLSQKAHEALYKIVCSDKKSFTGPAKGPYIEICDFFRIGSYDADLSQVEFNEEELSKLRQIYRTHTGPNGVHYIFPDKNGTPSHSRTDLAKSGNNEKRKGLSIYADMLVTASLKDEAFSFVNADGSAVVCLRFEDLNLTAIKKVIVAENLEVVKFSKLLKEIVPSQLSDALVIYRGHGENINHVKKAVASLNADTDIYYFFDFDPSGFVMTDEYLSVRKGKVLLPDMDARALMNFSKSTLCSNSFDKQHLAISFLTQSRYKNTDFFERKEVKDTLLSMINCRLAVTQEAMSAHGIKLKAI